MIFEKICDFYQNEILVKIAKLPQNSLTSFKIHEISVKIPGEVSLLGTTATHSFQISYYNILLQTIEFRPTCREERPEWEVIRLCASTDVGLGGRLSATWLLGGRLS